jgi:hypothetical protein
MCVFTCSISGFLKGDYNKSPDTEYMNLFIKMIDSVRQSRLWEEAYFLATYAPSVGIHLFRHGDILLVATENGVRA